MTQEANNGTSIQEKKPVLCIYHGNCDDGFASAYFVRRALGDANVEFYPGVYQQTPPDCTGREVLMVDFSYKRPVLEGILEACNSLTILDHHKTAAEDLAFLPSSFGCHENDMAKIEQKALALFDMNRCGTTLVWDYFNPGVPRPTFVQYIEDRDLWRKQLPAGDEFTIALRSYAQDFDVWEELIEDDDGVDKLIDEGHAIQRYYRLRVEELKRSAYLAQLIGFPSFPCMISNAPYFAASEVAGGELAEMPNVSFGASYFEVKAGVFQYSLRSRGEFDVSKIAREFGGGGHKNAAGFSMNGAPGARRTLIRKRNLGCVCTQGFLLSSNKVKIPTLFLYHSSASAYLGK